ncbi:MAG TPA: glycosyltransferase family 39 protein [Terriglobales bacterium]|nr:glycosyltransferase family 39 protein [Terriglobales bacterium]
MVAASGSRQRRSSTLSITRPSTSYDKFLPLVVIGIGFLLRLIVASTTYLDPDEAVNYFQGNQKSLWDVYHASLGSMHPPLLLFCIYSLKALGRSEFALRLPSVIAGTLSCWFGYKWLSKVADDTIALSGAVLFSLVPPLFSLESEVRQYSLLLLFIMAAFYFLESALEKLSVREMLLFSAALWLGLSVQYSALLFTVCIGIYTLLRFDELRSGSRFIVAWVFGQLVFVGLALFFYKTHVPVFERGISGSWLRKLFYHSGDPVVSFLATNTYRFFHFLFGQPVIGSIMLLLFVIGLVSLVTGRHFPIRVSRPIGFTSMFAAVLCWALSLGGIYPFGGTRHTIFLLPFVVLAAVVGLVTLLGNYAKFAPTVAAGMALVCILAPVPAGPSIRPPQQSLTFMHRAVTYVRQTVPAGEMVLVDQQSVFPFRYYFCRDDVFPFRQNPQNFECGGYRVYRSDVEWLLSAEHLESEVSAARRAFGAPPAERVLLFQTGWSVNNQKDLRDKLRASGCTSQWAFGKNIIACDIGVPDRRMFSAGRSTSKWSTHLSSGTGEREICECRARRSQSTNCGPCVSGSVGIVPSVRFR